MRTASIDQPTPGYTKRILDAGPLLGVVGVCAIAAWTKWVKLYSLISGDSGWWLHEVARQAWGDVPYRDFYWPYGPLSMAVFSYPMHWFGVRFEVAQITIDILSVVIVILYACIMRYLMPPPLHFIGTILFVCVGATAQTYFSLFSILSYTPSVHVAAIGILVMLLGIFRHLDRRGTRFTTAMIAIGAWICWLGKQETLLASIVVFVLLMICDREVPVTRYLWLGALCFTPPVLAYAAIAAGAGADKLLACLQGFGLATNACPWWPTGVGLLGACSALGETAVVVACASLFDRTRWRKAFGRRYAVIWLLAAIGLAAYMIFEWRLWSGILFGSGPLLKRVLRSAPELLSSSAVLRPALWCSILYWLYLFVAGLHSAFRLSADTLKLFLLLTVAVVMSARSLFGSVLVSWPEVPAIAYPFLLILGPYLLLRALHLPYPRAAGLVAGRERIPIVVLATLMLAYAAIRLAGAYPGLLSERQFTLLQTRAGPVRVKEGSLEAKIYDYVIQNTTTSDSILEVPFGGGLTVATGRRNALYSTLFFQLRPPGYIQQYDLQAVRRRPPEVVIAPDEEHLGTAFGIKGTVGCAFPELVWQSNRLSWDPNYILPVIRYIEENYRVDRKIGPWVIWTAHA